MKKNLNTTISICLFFFCVHLQAQVGIGTVAPDPSAILELSSDHQGFLMPRLTTAQRDAIITPANGLMIYNLSTSDVQMNTGTSILPVWLGMKDGGVSPITSVTATGEITTSSVTDELVPGMTLSPPAGTYLVLFNAQYGMAPGTEISTAQAVIDLEAAYNQIMAVPATNTTHGAIFGNGETLLPGVYDYAAAGSMAGTLTMDGGGDTNSIFIIRIGGALAAGAGTTVVLTNGARARNIFWVSEGALSLAAGTTMKGTLIAHNAALAYAAGGNLVGRMFSTTGAVSFGPGTIAAPPGISPINFGVLNSFIIFSSAGAIANTGSSTMTGDVGTNAGAIAGFEMLDGNIYYPGSPPPTANSIGSFSIYQNGVLVANSERTTDPNSSLISLQAMATIDAGQSIDVRWKVDEGGVTLANRILTVVNAN